MTSTGTSEKDYSSVSAKAIDFTLLCSIMDRSYLYHVQTRESLQDYVTLDNMLQRAIIAAQYEYIVALVLTDNQISKRKLKG